MKAFITACAYPNKTDVTLKLKTLPFQTLTIVPFLHVDCNKSSLDHVLHQFHLYHHQNTVQHLVDQYWNKMAFPQSQDYPKPLVPTLAYPTASFMCMIFNYLRKFLSDFLIDF